MLYTSPPMKTNNKTTSYKKSQPSQTNPVAVQPVVKAKTIKLGIDVHLDLYVVVRQIDGGAPQPPLSFSPEKFLECAKKQLSLAEQVFSC